MKKERLTERDKYGHAYFPECFEEPCLGSGCEKEICEFMEKVCEKLAKYEDKENIDCCDECSECGGDYYRDEHGDIICRCLECPDGPYQDQEALDE